MKPSQTLASYRLIFGIFLLFSLVFLGGCSDQSEPLSVESLQNTTYQGIYPETVQLSDGRYEGEPFQEDGASRPMLIFIEPTAFGDLDGDGLEDAAVLLVETSGGSGAFIYLAAVLNQDGKPHNQATLLLGDRVQVDELTIETGEIQIKMLAHGPDDPLCCPTQETSVSYTLAALEAQQ